MYEVIHFFTDLQDNEYPYHVGDLFPHDGLVVDSKRLKELSGSNNLQKKPLIRLIEKQPLQMSESEHVEKQYTRTDINRMSTAELQTLATEIGIGNAQETSGNELKKILIEHFGL